MVNIPINAHVKCADGACGKSTNVIVNPVNHQVTHIVIKDNSLPDNSTRLVPVGKVASATQDQITLSCTKEELAKMPPFIITNFIQESASGKAYESGAVHTFPYVINETAYDSVQERNIPLGELAIYCGMQIEATDGKVGKLNELVLDPQNGGITHLLMREGHLWGKKEVSVPVSAIDFCDSQVVYLKLDKEDIKGLPAVPLKRD
jgi:sporulation protein YlmC with PRC-barrel domain